MDAVEFFDLPTDRSWTRDYCPIFVKNAQRRSRRHRLALQRLGQVRRTGKRTTRFRPSSPSIAAAQLTRSLATPGIVLEGGSIDVNGAGSLLTTEECLLSRVRRAIPA